MSKVAPDLHGRITSSLSLPPKIAHRRSVDSLPSKLPLVVVGGAQKSASTSFAQWLGRHSAIRMIEEECLAFEGPRRISKVARLSRRAIQCASEGTILGLKRPEVFHNAPLLFRLLSAFPRSTVVVVLRNPLHRTLSALLHYRRLGVISPRMTLSNCLDDWEDAGDSGTGQIISYSFYAESLERLFTRAEKPFVVFQDDLLIDIKPVETAISQRLDLSPERLGALPHANSAANRAELPLRLAETIGALSYRWDPLERVLVRRSTPSRAAGKLVSLAGRPFRPTRSSASGTEDDDEVLNRLRNLFVPDLERVSDLLGRPVPGTWLSERPLT